MPLTIPLTARQRETLGTLLATATAANRDVNAFCIALIEGVPNPPRVWGGYALTPAGLVVGDAPHAARPPERGRVPIPPRKR